MNPTPQVRAAISVVPAPPLVNIGELIEQGGMLANRRRTLAIAGHIPADGSVTAGTTVVTQTHEGKKHDATTTRAGR